MTGPGPVSEHNPHGYGWEGKSNSNLSYVQFKGYVPTTRITPRVDQPRNLVRPSPLFEKPLRDLAYHPN